MILKRPIITEKSMLYMENNNTICFIVDNMSNKERIKKEFEETYEVKVDKINTMMTPNGKKKAIIKISDEFNAEDIAIKLGFM
ncbi:MAG: 50S ribosomal protein L23 [Candidatus Methanoliparum thermophilum]|uniref:Large ribosomal subunit protein uL23 n=1 Tax=Methanoliparum thermophilum TaxID=2491083 RepID=A0A520KUD9_METT2|nr:50S ribosomal protein L23 [Candidatus Methanoliparum sp. LAM-1]RZN65526.1 MAG: 50S ribosomal protein L23 [Candidatus Methanoliparum thermophilum]BDC35379.1 50S ribosomal protein L23 [Candidatus Methanoliparum sp. LAM-1]